MRFIIVEGPDGTGKETFSRLLSEILSEKENRKIIDIRGYQKKGIIAPKLEEMVGKIVLTAEPTYWHSGLTIRDELIKKGRDYDIKTIAEMYSIDRLINYENIIIPLKDKEGWIIQERSILSSLTYQSKLVFENGLEFDELLKLKGNETAIKNPPESVIILGCSIEEAEKRYNKRIKNDDAIFEVSETQKKLKKAYEGEDIRNLLTERDIKIIYFDTSSPIKETKKRIHLDVLGALNRGMGIYYINY